MNPYATVAVSSGRLLASRFASGQKRLGVIRCSTIGMTTIVGCIPSVAQLKSSPIASEQTNVVRHMDEVVVSGRSDDLIGVADSASQGAVGSVELSRRPTLRPGEVLESVPGVIITQHAGGGKANQYFLRGFNLDHGTDFATSVDGVPVNLGTHAHGQGYTDINWVIPELVQSVNYRKGPYYADAGDFGTAGSADLRYVGRLEQSLLKLEGGTFANARGLWADSLKVSGGDLIYALEGMHDNGAWLEPANYYRGNLFTKYSRGDDAQGWSLGALAYYGKWTSTDQIPLRAITGNNGVPGGFTLDRFGTLDPESGGLTWRAGVSAQWHRRDSASASTALCYAYYYGLDLFSNFTGALDQVNGDEIFQKDRRLVMGTKLDHTWFNEWKGRTVETKFGLDIRSDVIEVGLFATKAREVLATTRSDDVVTSGVSPWLENRTQWNSWFRTVVGVRGDLYAFNVDNHAGGISNGASDAIGSPKLSFIFGPWARTELYLSGGYGFHTADARATATATDRANVFTRQRGAEVGIRSRVVPHLQSTISLWLLDSDNEVVFAGDSGANEPTGRKGRRYGLEFANFYEIVSWLTLDADAALSHARFRDHNPLVGDFIPDSVESMAAIGLAFHDLGRFFGSLRARYFGSRPLIEDSSVRSRPSLILNAQVGVQLNQKWSLTMEVLNLLDRKSNDQEYYYSSRLPGEPVGPEADGGYLDHHVHPAEPRTIRLALTGRF